MINCFLVEYAFEIDFICSKVLRFNVEPSFAAWFIASEDSFSDFEKYAHMYATDL